MTQEITTSEALACPRDYVVARETMEASFREMESALLRVSDWKKSDDTARHRVPRILVVDDDRDYAAAARATLAMAGFDVSVEASGVQAIERLQSEPFDVLVCDVVLGDGLGMDVVRSTRLPTLLISGLVSGELDALRQRTNAEAALDKMEGPSALILAVRRLVIERHRRLESVRSPWGAEARVEAAT